MYYMNPIDLFSDVIRSIGFNVSENNSSITIEAVGSWHSYEISISYDYELDVVTFITPLHLKTANSDKTNSIDLDTNHLRKIVSMINQELTIGYLVANDNYIKYIFQIPFIQHFENTSDLVERTINLISYTCDSIYPIIQASLTDKNIDATRIKLLLSTPLGEA